MPTPKSYTHSHFPNHKPFANQQWLYFYRLFSNWQAHDCCSVFHEGLMRWPYYNPQSLYHIVLCYDRRYHEVRRVWHYLNLIQSFYYNPQLPCHIVPCYHRQPHDFRRQKHNSDLFELTCHNLQLPCHIAL